MSWPSSFDGANIILPGATANTGVQGITSLVDARSNLWNIRLPTTTIIGSFTFPAPTITVTSTDDFPSTGQIVFSYDTLSNATVSTATPNIVSPINLPLAGGSLTVNSTTGFPSSGTITIVGALIDAQGTVITYTSKDATHFLGCTGGLGVLFGINSITPLPLSTFYPPVVVTYTGKTSTTFTGCTGGTPGYIQGIFNSFNTVTLYLGGGGTVIPSYALYTQGTNNTAVGSQSNAQSYFPDANVSLGCYALQNAKQPTSTIAIGAQAMRQDNTSGAFGNGSLQSVYITRLTPSNTVAIGTGALRQIGHTTGHTAVGHNALAINTDAVENTAIGNVALANNGSLSMVFSTVYQDGNVVYINNPQASSAFALSTQTFTPDMVGGVMVYQYSNESGATSDTIPAPGGTGQYDQSTIIGYIDSTRVIVDTPHQNGNTSSYFQSAVRVYYGTPYKEGTIFQTGTTITGVAPASFTQDMVGGNIIFSNGWTAIITAFVNSTTLTAYPSQTQSSGPSGTTYKLFYGGSYNSAVGSRALQSNATGISNAAMGGASLQANTTGKRNTTLGVDTATSTENGLDNTAIGTQALQFTRGVYNSNGSLTASQLSGTSITASGAAAFTSDMTGGTIVYNNYVTTTVTAASDGVDVSTAGTINVASTANLPAGGGSVYILTSLTTFVTSGVVSFSSSISVNSTTFWPASGQFLLFLSEQGSPSSVLVGNSSRQFVVTYTSKDPTHFLGCTIPYFASATSWFINTGASVFSLQPQLITYTGTTATTLTGCTGGNGLLSAGSSEVRLINKPQSLVTYVSPTTLTATTSLPPIVARPFKLFYGVSYTTGTITSQSGLVVTGSGTTWIADMIGGSIVYSNGESAQIVGVSSATSLTVDRYIFNAPAAASSYRIYYGGARNTAVGSGALTTAIGYNNTAVGYGAGTTLSTSVNATVVGAKSSVSSNNVVVGENSTDNGQSNVIVLGSGVTAANVTSANQLVLGSGITAQVGSVTLTNYININIGGVVYKMPIGV